MKYVDDASNSFDELNRILNNNLEFLNLLDADTELYDYMRDYINKLSDKYRLFVRKNKSQNTKTIQSDSSRISENVRHRVLLDIFVIYS